MEGKRIIKTSLKNNIKYSGKKYKKEIEIQYYTVEKIEENIVELENRDTLEMINVNIGEFLETIKEGDIVKKVNNRYLIDKDETLKTKKRIEDKMNDLWN